jgi:hypothetical protein
MRALPPNNQLIHMQYASVPRRDAWSASIAVSGFPTRALFDTEYRSVADGIVPIDRCLGAVSPDVPRTC